MSLSEKLFQSLITVVLIYGIRCQVSVRKCSGFDPGFLPCSNRFDAGRRWYYSTELNRCLTFEFSGCGGNANNFASLKECISSCYPQDGSACHKGSTVLGPCSRDGKRQCGHNAVCKMGFLSSLGQCCDKRNEGFWDESYATICPEGSIAEPNVVATDCTHLSCSEGFTCTQINPIFARCCAANSKKSGKNIEEFLDVNKKKKTEPFSTSCPDRNILCPAWAQHDHCYINPGYMLINCQRSCKSCDGIPPPALLHRLVKFFK